MNFQIFIRPLGPIFVFLGLTFVSAPALAKDSGVEAQAYDELVDKRGQLRPQYQSIREYLENTGEWHQRRFRAYSNRRFLNDNPLDDIPKILTEGEYDTIKAGVEQRARALLALVRDHHSGRQRYLEILPRHIMNRILGRSFDTPYSGHLREIENFMFFYGPDLVRDESGRFVVLEDNTGFIGGLGDLKISHDLMMERHPRLRQAGEFLDPMNFYRGLAETARKHARNKGGKAVLYLHTPFTDNESVRLKAIFQSLGLEVVTPKGRTRMVFDESGVYTENRVGGAKEKVGFILLTDEFNDVDHFHPANLDRMYLYAAREFIADKAESVTTRREIQDLMENVNESTGLPDMVALKAKLHSLLSFSGFTRNRPFLGGLTEAIFKGRVDASFIPGMDFISDKELYTYIEKFIRFYLKEEPILRSLRTYSFATSSGQLKTDLLEKVMANKNSWVIKPVDGRSGDGIWVGPNVTQREFNRARAVILKNPSGYQAQEYVHPSTMRHKISDVRPISLVSEKDMVVGPLWGRNVEAAASQGKMNVAKGGAVTAVLIQKECENALRIENQ